MFTIYYTREVDNPLSFPVRDEFSDKRTDVKVSVSEDMLVKSRKVVKIKGNFELFMRENKIC